MFDRMIGNFLKEEGKVTDTQLRQIYDYQSKHRSRLGVIAVSEGLISIAMAEEINDIQTTSDARFGEIALSKGYLTQENLQTLLEKQKDRFTSFCTSIYDLHIMDEWTLNSEINKYALRYSFNQDQLNILKKDDIDGIIDVFLADVEAEVKDLYAIYIKSFYRLIDEYVSFEKIQTKTNISAECIGLQNISGNGGYSVNISGSYNVLCDIAIKYTNEEIVETKEDALDAICEFINCVNGIYVTKKSYDEQSLELEPPEYMSNFANVSSDKIYSLPVVSDGRKLYINISNASTTQMK